MPRCRLRDRRTCATRVGRNHSTAAVGGPGRNRSYSAATVPKLPARSSLLSPVPVSAGGRASSMVPIATCCLIQRVRLLGGIPEGHCASCRLGDAGGIERHHGLGDLCVVPLHVDVHRAGGREREAPEAHRVSVTATPTTAGDEDRCRRDALRILLRGERQHMARERHRPAFRDSGPVRELETDSRAATHAGTTHHPHPVRHRVARRHRISDDHEMNAKPLGYAETFANATRDSSGLRQERVDRHGCSENRFGRPIPQWWTPSGRLFLRRGERRERVEEGHEPPYRDGEPRGAAIF